jgi:hypothetical protein
VCTLHSARCKIDSLVNLCAEVSAKTLVKNPASQIFLSHASRAAHLKD